MNLTAICTDINKPRIDNGEVPSGITLNKKYKVYAYFSNADNHGKPPMIRIKNDLGERANYAAFRFEVSIDKCIKTPNDVKTRKPLNEKYQTMAEEAIIHYRYHSLQDDVNYAIAANVYHSLPLSEQLEIAETVKELDDPYFKDEFSMYSPDYGYIRYVESQILFKV